MPYSAEISALMSLESPRSIQGKSQTILLDAGIYYSKHADPLVAALRFYNDTDVRFDADGGLFYVVAKVCLLIRAINFYKLIDHFQVVQMRRGAETPSDRLHEEDYTLIGDIISVRLPHSALSFTPSDAVSPAHSSSKC